MSVALPDRVVGLECAPLVISPGHLEDAGRALDALHSETLAKAPPAVEVLDELAGRKEEGCLLSRGAVIKVLTLTRANSTPPFLR